ncbi:MAG TPA: zinc-dependent metalloprotease [Pirellulaceae bacterium]|jgi:hypothetical protein|nr:zinc-dependent metalloprotease [Pirellulaceae bacterium]
MIRTFRSAAVRAAFWTLLAFATCGFATSAFAADEAAPKWKAILGDKSKTLEGMLTVHKNDEKVFFELTPGDYSSEYIVLISISKGIGVEPLYGGMSWGFGDDWVWQFRKIGDRVMVVRKNVRFKAKAGTPEAGAVSRAYSDSVLFSLPAGEKGPKGGDLVDVTSIFMSDLPQIQEVLKGFAFSGAKSTWADVKTFPDNVELEVAATYASSGTEEFDTVPDSRGVTLNVHYSVSKVPSTDYKPRVADDRVGYFMTAVKDFTDDGRKDDFIRYVNRWNLQKADPSKEKSPPKKPIVFWVENTVPFQYRKTVADGIAEWNKAFEQAGFLNAIEVRQQPESADWDPEDVNYNTFRWITSNAGFAMGPSRVNPYSGQILDADIIFDADFLRSWKMEFETLTPQSIAAMTGGDLDSRPEANDPNRYDPRRATASSHSFYRAEFARQLAFGGAALAAVAADPKVREAEMEKLIQQGLKEVVMHEVGHTLGLRHNFKASKYRTLEAANDPNAPTEVLTASVMDYTPVNISPEGVPQGQYYQTALGPYDLWAIEYGYREFPSNEKEGLTKIAARSGEAELLFSTDEDTLGVDPDPDSNRFDFGKDPVAFAERRLQIARQTIPTIVDRLVEEGDDYSDARKAFNVLLSQQGTSCYFVSRYVGGFETSRSHKGDANGKPPIQPVDVKTQRDALAFLERTILADEPFQFPKEVYPYLGVSRWSHWGNSAARSKELPLHDTILNFQDRVFAQLLSPITLTRIHDGELQVKPDQDYLTTAELIDRLTKATFTEVLENKFEGKEFTAREPAVSSLRRNLQRKYVERLGNLALGRAGAPEDCVTIAYAQLDGLKTKIDEAKKNEKLDAYTKAHLLETGKTIERILDAKIAL